MELGKDALMLIKAKIQRRHTEEEPGTTSMSEEFPSISLGGAYVGHRNDVQLLFTSATSCINRKEDWKCYDASYEARNNSHLEEAQK